MEQNRQNSGGCTDDHGSNGPAFVQTARHEYREGQRQKDAAAAQRHGKVIPEKDLRAFVGNRNDRSDEQHKENRDTIETQQLAAILYTQETC